MFSQNSSGGCRVLKGVACVTSFSMAWLIGAPVAMAAMKKVPKPAGHARQLSQDEMHRIMGASGGGGTIAPSHALSTNLDGGSTYPWEGSVGGANTGNGNKQTKLPIVGWKARGGMAVSLSLFHSSEGNHNSELGRKWTHSYDIYLVPDAVTGDITVHWGDDLSYPFTLNIGGSFDAPTGIHDTFVQSGTGTSATYALTTKNQIVYTFGFVSDGNGGGGWYCTSIADRNGNTITIGHNAAGFVTTITDPTSRTLTLSYTSGKITGISDPLSRNWTLHYNTSDELTSVDLPVVGSTTYSVSYGYNAAHDITSFTDLRGKVWTKDYYSDDSIKWEKDPLGNETDYDYYSGYTKVTDANGHFIKHNYASGKLTSVQDGAGETEYYGYDTFNNKNSVTDKRGKVWSCTFDGMGNVLTKTDPLNHVTTMTYNAKNDPTSVVTELGKETDYVYNTAGNLTSVTDPLSNVTSATYNSDGTLATKTDSNSHTMSYGYDTDGNLISVTTPGSKVTAFGYNGLGVKNSRTDAKGKVTTYTLDAWNRTTAASFTATGSASQTFTYDPCGNITQFTDGTGTTSRAYDDAGRMTSETTNLGTFTYAYDATGKKGLLSSVTDPSSRTVTYTYKATNKLASSSDGTSTVSYTYDASQNETGITNPNGTSVVKTYDDAGQLASVTNYDASSNVLSSFAYTYTGDGQKDTVTEADGSVVSYGYNDAERLTSETRIDGATSNTVYSASYSLDGEGNRTSQTIGSATTTFTYNSDDGLTAASSTTGGLNASYGYNDNGEQTSRTIGTASYSLGYDGDGQMISLNDGTTSKTYAYDAAGRRVARSVGSTQTDFAYSGGSVWLEGQNGNVTASHLYGNTLVGKNGEVNLYDGQGSSRQTTDGTGSVTSERTFEGFGQVVASTGSGQTYGYAATSGYRDDGDAGLTHVGARYYDAMVGRFITRDTCLNQKPYTYCEADPINATDPTGHNPLWGIDPEEGILKNPVTWSTTLAIGAEMGTSLGPVGAGAFIVFVGVVQTYCEWDLIINFTPLGGWIKGKLK